MPTRPKRICSQCRRGKVDPATNTCSLCGPIQTHGWGRRTKQGTRQERGYGQDWQRLRAAFLAEHPLCEECEKTGRVEPAAHVDHVDGFDGLDDPKRLDWNNLQALCERCHMRKTARSSHT